MVHFRGIRVAGLIATFAFLAAAPASGAVSGIYWANFGEGVLFPDGPDPLFNTHHIGRYDLATGDARPVRFTGDYSQPEAVVLDSAAGHIYWFSNGFNNEGLYRTDRDGSRKIQLLGADPSLPFHAITGDAALDAVHGHLYWPEVLGSQPYSLWRYDIRNPGAPELYLEGLAIHDLAIDSAGEYAYWVSEQHFETNLKIGRIHLATGQLETLVAYQESPFAGWLQSIALDETNNKLYWSLWSTHEQTMDSNGIWRSNLDGSGIEHLAPVLATSMKIDSQAGQLYWTSSFGLYRSDLDIDNIETLLPESSESGSVLFDAHSIALDPNPIPLPGAAWAGLGLLGALALRRRRMLKKNRFI